MEIVLCVTGMFAAFIFGTMLGKYTGYQDAQPKRDARGRFISRGR